eukprot:6347136-Pyramimonas_sp.AAC.1
MRGGGVCARRGGKRRDFDASLEGESDASERNNTRARLVCRVAHYRRRVVGEGAGVTCCTTKRSKRHAPAPLRQAVTCRTSRSWVLHRISLRCKVV